MNWGTEYFFVEENFVGLASSFFPGRTECCVSEKEKVEGSVVQRGAIEVEV